MAEVLNTALEFNRLAVNQGWSELDTMIGHRGKTISSELYIDVVPTGDFQHKVGPGQ